MCFFKIPANSIWVVVGVFFSLKIFIYFLFLFFLKETVYHDFWSKKSHSYYRHVILKDVECLTTYFFSFFFYKTQKFHSHIALKQNNHSNSTVLTKGAALPFFCLWSLGDIWGAWRGKRGRMFSKMMGGTGETLVKRDSLPFTHMTRSNRKI